MALNSKNISTEIQRILNGEKEFDLNELIIWIEEFIKLNPRYDIDERLSFLFRAYDEQKSGEISLTLLSDCIYDLYLCPTADEVVNIIKLFIKYRNKDKQNDKNNKSLMKKFKKEKETEKIKYNEFRILMNSILISGLFKPVSKEILEEAFKKFQHPKYGHILWKDMEEFLISSSDKFNDEELNNFKDFLGINEKKLKFFSEDYVCALIPEAIVKEKEDVYYNLFKSLSFIKK